MLPVRVFFFSERVWVSLITFCPAIVGQGVSGRVSDPHPFHPDPGFDKFADADPDPESDKFADPDPDPGLHFY